jgi:hypothetical protein
VMAVVGRTYYKGAASDDRARIFPSPNPQPSTTNPQRQVRCASPPSPPSMPSLARATLA